MKKILLICFISMIFINTIKAEEIVIDGKSAVLIEASTGEILYQKEKDLKLHPASMTKMMSMLLILEEIEKGNLSWNEKITISENASSMGGSQILLETGEQMTVYDLFKGVAVASGNDAVVALSERISGTTEDFIKLMNEKSKKLNLKNTNFKNVHGLDDNDHYSSSYDMALIAKELVKYEKLFEFTSIYEDYLRKGTDKELWLVNTNKLVRYYKGVDGLKTGYTADAGYCLTATINKNGFRVIAVVMGASSSSERNKEVIKLIDYAYNMYKADTVLSKKDIIDTVNISLAKNQNVEITSLEDYKKIYKKNENIKKYNYKINIDKIKLPLKKGDIIGNIKIYDNNKVIKEIKATVNKNVNKANIFTLYIRNIKDILTGNLKVN